MPNPFLTNAPNKKGRHQQQEQRHQQQEQRHQQQEQRNQVQHQQQEQRHQQQEQPQPRQENPFSTIKHNSHNSYNSHNSHNSHNSFNSFSEQKCVPEPVQIPLSFEESFPSLAHNQIQNHNQTPNPVPKLNFKSAVQQGQPMHHQPSHQSNQTQGQSQPSNQIQPSHQIQSSHQIQPMHYQNQIPNQFLRPMNQFLNPVNRIHYHRDHDHNECNEDLNSDAYDSAYTKYYED